MIRTYGEETRVINDLLEKKYIYNELEVVLTGRTAIKRVGLRGRQDILYEIEPLNKEDGSFKKWIRMGELYEITELRA